MIFFDSLFFGFYLNDCEAKSSLEKVKYIIFVTKYTKLQKKIKLS